MFLLGTEKPKAVSEQGISWDFSPDKPPKSSSQTSLTDFGSKNDGGSPTKSGVLTTEAANTDQISNDLNNSNDRRVTFDIKSPPLGPQDPPKKSRFIVDGRPVESNPSVPSPVSDNSNAVTPAMSSISPANSSLSSSTNQPQPAEVRKGRFSVTEAGVMQGVDMGNIRSGVMEAHKSPALLQGQSPRGDELFESLNNSLDRRSRFAVTAVQTGGLLNSSMGAAGINEGNLSSSVQSPAVSSGGSSKPSRFTVSSQEPSQTNLHMGSGSTATSGGGGIYYYYCYNHYCYYYC